MNPQAVSQVLDSLNAASAELRACTAKLCRSEAIRAAHQIAEAKWVAYCASHRAAFVARYGATHYREPSRYDTRCSAYVWETFEGWVVSPVEPPLGACDEYLRLDHSCPSPCICYRRNIFPAGVDPLNEVARGAQGVRWTGD